MDCINDDKVDPFAKKVQDYVQEVKATAQAAIEEFQKELGS